MRHEDATAAMDRVREWFGGALSKGEGVDAKMARLIVGILEADQLSTWLHDHGDWRGEDSQKESVDLLWAVVKACDLDAIRQAIADAQKYADELSQKLEKRFD